MSKSNSIKALVKKLVGIAKNYGVKVEFEKTSVPFLFRRSEYKFSDSRILVYFHNEFTKLVTLAHEVGHVLDKKVFRIDIIGREKDASEWALKFLKRNKFKRIDEAKELYAECLKHYEDEYGNIKILKREARIIDRYLKKKRKIT